VYRESLPATWTVQAGGRRYDVSSDPIVSRLRNAERNIEDRGPQLKQAGDYFSALAAEAASFPAGPPESTGSARVKLDAILAGSEYAHLQRQSWWDRLRARFNQMLFNALVRILQQVGGQRSLASALLWIAICAAAILIAYWIFRRWFQAARMGEIALESAAVPARSWQEWVFTAREAAGQGDYRMAIHCAYWAGIARLQELGALSPDRSKTPREYLRALGKSKPIAAEAAVDRRRALSTLTSQLETTWYGYRRATEADFQDTLSRLEDLGCNL